MEPNCGHTTTCWWHSLELVGKACKEVSSHTGRQQSGNTFLLTANRKQTACLDMELYLMVGVIDGLVNILRKWYLFRKQSLPLLGIPRVVWDVSSARSLDVLMFSIFCSLCACISAARSLNIELTAPFSQIRNKGMLQNVTLRAKNIIRDKNLEIWAPSWQPHRCTEEKAGVSLNPELFPDSIWSYLHKSKGRMQSTCWVLLLWKLAETKGHKNEGIRWHLRI